MNLVDLSRISLLVLILGLVISLATSTMYTDSLAITWVIIGLSIMFNLLLLVYMYFHSRLLKGPGGKFLTQLSNTSIYALLPVLLVGLIIFSTNAVALQTDSYPDWLWISNSIISCLLGLMYFVVFPVAIYTSCISTNPKWRLGGLWPKSRFLPDGPCSKI